jgi:2-dehydro-3-deoxyphosphogluconate aldolase/(4S)-4-hydroxy-2-oxoglutarate aldolase
VIVKITANASFKESSNKGSGKMPSTRELISGCRVMPVLVIERIADAVPLADALVAGGARAIEVTLRTPCALDAICAIRKAHENLVIGAGTVLKVQDFTDAGIAGAQFYVSPGATASLLDAARTGDLPWMPGVATVSEAMQMAEFGFDSLKLFPALVSGGVAMLKALNAPLPHLRFCPTGGITAVNVQDYLAQPNVICVGGSWIADAKSMRAQDWAGIEATMRAALSV